MDAASDSAMRDAYLGRLGFTADDAKALVSRDPNAADLQSLLTASLMTIPFENLGQHDHPADGEDVPALSKPVLPKLDAASSLDKLVNKKRGGFCYEINYAFAWLLRQLGYAVRLGRSDVITPDGPSPGHLVLFVDGLGDDALMVDPGFGDPVRVPLPVTGEAAEKELGETYTLAPASEFGLPERFTHALMRGRAIGSATAFWDFLGAPNPPPEPMPPMPVYAVNINDDLGLDAPEFVEGFGSVLAQVPENLFASKRICVLAQPDGHVTLGKDYVKTITRGVEVSRTELPTEKEWRAALAENFGITLTAE